MAVQPPTQAPAGQPPPEPPEPDEEGKLLTILEHIRELRYRVMVSVGALMVGVLVSFWPLTAWTVDFLKRPAEAEIEGFETFFFDPLEGWTTYFGVSLLLGIALSMPVMLYQALAFVGPGLSNAERRWLYPIVIGASASFVGGMAFAYYLELPAFLGFLLDPPGGIGEPLIGVRKYLGFVTRLLLVMGLIFELPLVVMGLAKLGVVTSRRLWGWWRHAIVLAFVAAAIVTPTIDPINQSIVAAPIIILYFAGIGLARLVEGNPVLRR